MCQTCANPDFSHPDASCVFGCGSYIDSDWGYCQRCNDHSANRSECETCGTAREDWGGVWEQVTP